MKKLLLLSTACLMGISAMSSCSKKLTDDQILRAATIGVNAAYLAKQVIVEK